MKIELKPSLVIPEEELCTAAAFLEIPALYGIPSGWMRAGSESIGERAAEIARRMEAGGKILPEPGGTVRMEPRLYAAAVSMGRAKKLARLGYAGGGGAKRLYFYRDAEGLTFMRPDGRGNAGVGRISLKEALTHALTETEDSSDRDMFFGGTGEWMSALVYARRDDLCEPVCDLAWSAGEGRESLPECWERFVRALWEEE